MSTMNRRECHRRLLASALAPSLAAGPWRAARAADAPPPFDPERFERRTVSDDQRQLVVRAYEGLPTVARPLEPAHQALNLYIPEAYFNGDRVGRHDASSAPIFLPNAVGGYMPALPARLGERQGPPPAPGTPAGPDAITAALLRGLVVACPGARGRTLRGADGRWTGKAPAAIVDLKAAVRWLRAQADRMPGDTRRIVSNGTSAGGALSSLLGASGDTPALEAELRALGAAPGSDALFAVSAYCPIVNLEQADGAYEWQFRGLADYRSIQMTMLDFRVQRTEVPGRLDATEQAWSAELMAGFIDHVNGLSLRDPDGRLLRLAADGSGPLQDHLTALLMASAQRALDAGQDLSAQPWVQRQGGRVQGLDFLAHVRGIGRMKALPAFDGLSLETGENQLFGDAGTDKRHFTAWAAAHSRVGGARADERVVAQMNPMRALADPASRVAPHWRIRHGTRDRDTALAIPALLAAAARARGATVDLALPWDRPHSGDYDLPELFDWIEALPAPR